MFIGYGIGEDNKPGRDKGLNAIKYLEHLATKHTNLHFHEFGDTHVKILLMDDTYAVMGSFNWLSFEGSSNRDFREELSWRINKKEEIEELFQRFFRKFPE